MPGEVHDSSVLFDQEAWPWSADLVIHFGEEPAEKLRQVDFFVEKLIWKKRGFNKRWNDKKGVRHNI